MNNLDNGPIYLISTKLDILALGCMLKVSLMIMYLYRLAILNRTFLFFKKSK